VEELDITKEITQIAPGVFDISGYGIRGDEVRRLKVGDFVCDCRFKHLKVIAIFPERFPKSRWEWLYRLAPWRWWKDVLDWCGLSWIYNLDIEVEDGSSCDFRQCCNLVPHDGYEHPSPEEMEEMERTWTES